MLKVFALQSGFAMVKIILIALTMFVLGGLATFIILRTEPIAVLPVPPEEKANSFARPTTQELPQNVKGWLENSLKFDLLDFANAKEYNGKQYLFVRSLTGGFRGERLVQITDVVVAEEEVVVNVKFNKPAPAQRVALSDIYDLVRIEATGLPARFVPIADEHILITSITGIHYLPNIVAQSRLIKVTSPAPNEVVGRRFSVSGIANAFEATLQYRLLDNNQNTLDGGFTTALQVAPGFTREPVVSDDGAGLWRYFDIGLMVPENIATGENLVIKIYDIASVELSQVVIPIKTR